MGRLKLRPKKTLRLTERRKTALHEAGHALVSAVLGYPTRADIIRKDGYEGGHVVMSARPYRDELAICFGGPLAEMRVGVSAQEALGISGRGDVQQVLSILRHCYGLNEYDPEYTSRFTEAQRRAGEILQAHDTKWMEISDALLRSEVVRVDADLTVRAAPEERAEAIAYWDNPPLLNAYPDPDPVEAAL